MENFLAFINFYGTYHHAPNKEPESFVSMLKISQRLAQRYIRIGELVDLILEITGTDSAASLESLSEATGVPIEDLAFYLAAIEILFPFTLPVRLLAGETRLTELAEQKKRIAINLFLETDLTDDQIIEEIDVEPADINACRVVMLGVQEEHQLIQDMKQEEEIREFFRQYPYSTIRDAARQLKMSARTMRIIVDSMRASGEEIKFNNVPVAMEREEIRKRVLEIKKEDPALTNSQVSLHLGVSMAEVKRAIKDALMVWQIEKADNYEFYFQKTLGELNDVRAECWQQHNNGKGDDGKGKVSSRWMEIALQAQEKQINMLGLKAPERVDIRQDIVVSKQERDRLVSAALATDSVDVDFDLIEVTGK